MPHPDIGFERPVKSDAAESTGNLEVILGTVLVVTVGTLPVSVMLALLAGTNGVLIGVAAITSALLESIALRDALGTVAEHGVTGLTTKLGLALLLAAAPMLVGLGFSLAFAALPQDFSSPRLIGLLAELAPFIVAGTLLTAIAYHGIECLGTPPSARTRFRRPTEIPRASFVRLALVTLTYGSTIVAIWLAVRLMAIDSLADSVRRMWET